MLYTLVLLLRKYNTNVTVKALTLILFAKNHKHVAMIVLLKQLQEIVLLGKI